MVDKFKIAGVIGNPISHSKSPLMHNYWIKNNDVKGHYIPMEVSENDFEQVVRTLPKMGFKGVNVTIPFKKRAYRLVDNLTETAVKCGSVNMITFNSDGSLSGDSTDGYGFIQNILENDSSFDFKFGKAVVLGAGGAACSVVASLINQGCKEVIIVSRTIEKAMEIVESVKGNITVLGWDSRSDALFDINLLVNCTPLGMVSKDELDIDLSLLPSYALVNDIVYNPIKTKLLFDAEKRGNKTVTGIGMLVHQARPAFKSWFEIDPIVTSELKEMLING